MAIHKLTDLMVRQATRPGLLADGGGLFLQVRRSVDGGVLRSWVARLRFPRGRTREMGLGRAEHVTLAAARELARQMRAQARDGIDPIDARRETRSAARVLRPLNRPAAPMTFRQCARAYIDAHLPSWRNDKHAAQWISSLRSYVYPVCGDVPVADVGAEQVVAVLDPIWSVKTETASRVRGRMEAILDWARVRGHRSGENPARWKGNLQHVFPPRGRVQKRGHHAAHPFPDMPEFWRALCERDGVGAEALRFTILTAARTGETLGATWSEIDLERRIWLVPADRMKAQRAHRVPLCAAAVALLRARGPQATGLVFHAELDPSRPLSNMTMLAALHRMGRRDLTVHGFRSAFRDWTAECTESPREVAEAALAHVVGDRVEAAYRRGDFFEKRRALMDAWGAYCAGGADAFSTSDEAALRAG